VGFLAFWQIPMIGTAVVLVAVVVVLSVRAWSRRGPVSADERKEIASAPMAPTQKGAWWGLLIGVVTLAVLSGILLTKGAAECWENDYLRLVVMGIFIGGIVAHLVMSNRFHITSILQGSMDEREGMIISRASIVLPPAILITLAAWMIMLTERYNEQGAVPLVYLNLVFGSTILVMLIAQSVGVLLGHWIGGFDGQG
jgi:hypothetical protein